MPCRGSLQTNAASMSGITTDTAVTTDTELLQLPRHVLLSVLQELDFWSVCAVSRTCKVLFQLAAHPAVHPSFCNALTVDWEWDLRSVLARTLRLPPQAFCVRRDAMRSRRWPVTIPLHNLRSLLGITDTEALAERVSGAVQAHAEKVLSWKYSSWRELPPVSVIRCCRADRATVRASLRPEAVVPAVLQQLQQLGCPPSAAPGTAAAPAPSTLPDTPTSAAAVMGDCLQVCHARLAAGLLQLSGGVTGSGSGGRTSPTEPRERLALSRAPAAHASAMAAARHLPDSSTARQATLVQLAGLAPQTTAEVLAPSVVRLIYIAAAADPGSCSFAAPHKPGWLLLMQQAVKLVLRQHLLQRDCCLAVEPDWERGWALASPAELQLCLAGFLHFPPRCLSPAAIYQCAIAVEAAAAEYASSGSSSGSMMDILGGQTIAEQPLPAQAALRQACQRETLRLLNWCFWLLGVS